MRIHASTQTVLAVTIAAAAMVGGALFFSNFSNTPDIGQPALSDSGSVDAKLDQIAKLVNRAMDSSDASVRALETEQKRLGDLVVALEAKLGNLSPDDGHHHSGEGAQPKESPPMKSTPSTDTEVGEQDLGRWMNEALQVGVWDSDATSAATEQAESSIRQTDGLNLAGLQCGDRFCKASIASTNGGKPDASQLFGLPPFLSDGFTVEEQDGTVSIYYTQSGGSLSDLRVEAAGG